MILGPIDLFAHFVDDYGIRSLLVFENTRKVGSSIDFKIYQW